MYYMLQNLTEIIFSQTVNETNFFNTENKPAQTTVGPMCT